MLALDNTSAISLAIKNEKVVNDTVHHMISEKTLRHLIGKNHEDAAFDYDSVFDFRDLCLI